jgi:hypothetical protein
METQTLQVTVNQVIETEKLEDLLYTALEGGSNDWYLLDDLTFMEGKVPNAYEGMPTAEWVILAILTTDLEIPILDIENPDDGPLGVLSGKKLQDAVMILAQKYHWVLDNIMTDAWDANDADAFMQCAVMGEIVFG